MQFSIDGKTLSLALAEVSRVIPRRAARPMLQNVCLSANGALELVGTDMEVGIRKAVPATVQGAGEILLPASRLQAVVKSLIKEEIQFTNGDGAKAELRGARKRFTLEGEDSEDFPVVPTFPKDADCTIPGEAFSFLVRSSAFACAGEETRYAIHGVCMDAKGGALRFIGTDGKRLAVATRKVWRTDSKAWTALLPVRAYTAVLAAMPKRAKTLPDVKVKLEAKRVLFQVQDTVIVAAKIDGTFPSWEEVIPARCASKATVVAAELEAAVKEAGILATEGSHAVALDIRSDSISVKSKVSNVGEVEAEVDAGLDGAPAAIHFNPRYLLDFLKVSTVPIICLEYNDPRSAVKLTDGNGLCYVVMPITLES